MSPQMIGSGLANDLLESITIALDSGAVFSEGTKPITIFRDAVAKAITDIEERAGLLRRFLRDGPYEHDGDISPELRGGRLTDEETARAITFIYSHVINCFQGRLAELLAGGPCAKLVKELKTNGQVSPYARLYMGDAVLFPGGTAGRYLKAADMHVISLGAPLPRKAEVLGVIEVKSYVCSKKRLWEQLARHRSRIQKCNLMSITENGTRLEARIAYPDNIFSVGVTAATWRIPRTFSLIQQEGKRILDIDEPRPPKENPWVKQIARDNWRIILRWSQEALASAAYEMTFWYMEKLGEMVFSEIMPPEWHKMTPAEAGQNAAKMMLYYAIPRCQSRRAEQRAIALYNTYGFGYALGMNFRDANGRREMLWPEDIDEIARTGATKHGCRIWR